jgi:hypothetical protein
VLISLQANLPIIAIMQRLRLEEKQMPESAPWKETIIIGTATVVALGVAGCGGSGVLRSQLDQPLKQDGMTYPTGTVVQLECTNTDKKSFGAHLLPEESKNANIKVNPLPLSYIPNSDAQTALQKLSSCTWGPL